VARPPKPQPVREKAREVFKTAILDAAEQAFAESGFHGAHMQEIARRAGLSVGSIYNHFGQKEDVLVALVDQRLAEMLQALKPAKGDPKDFAERLFVRLERVLAYRERHAAFFAVAVDLGILGDEKAGAEKVLGGRALPHAARIRRVWLDLVDEGLAAAALEPLDRELLAALLKTTLRTVARWSREASGPTRTSADTARLIVEVFFHGSGPRAKKRVTTSRAASH
jgi:AcrR family transcriptional regulator